MKNQNITFRTIVLVFSCFALSPIAQAVTPQVVWTPARPMHTARGFFTATKLLNGDVLVAGGYDSSANPPNFPDAEIYNPQTGLWTPISPMNSARAAAIALRLEDGRVMVIGGFDENFNVLASAEIYDPSTNTWSFTAPMNDARVEDFPAVLLPGSKVLVAGGTGSDGVTSLTSAEIYDEAANTWTKTGSMNVGRGEFVNALLNDGRLLVAGGIATEGTPIASAEIYDPATGTWTLTGSMSTGREDPGAIRLLDGRVLVTGGDSGEETPRFTSAEIFDPQSGQWTATGDMTTPRSEIEYATVLLSDGRVLVPGGHTAPHTSVSNADLYDPQTGTWSAAGSMSVPRSGHVTVLLDSGIPLVTGGITDPGGAGQTSVDIARELPGPRHRPAPPPRPTPPPRPQH